MCVEGGVRVGQSSVSEAAPSGVGDPGAHPAAAEALS